MIRPPARRLANGTAAPVRGKLKRSIFERLPGMGELLELAVQSPMVDTTCGSARYRGCRKG